MAKSTLDTHRLQAAIGVKEAGDSHHRVELHQGQRVRRIIEVNLIVSQFLHQVGWQGIHIYFQPQSQRLSGADPRANPSKGLTLDSLVELERVAPERLVSKGIKAEGPSAIGEHAACVEQD